MTVKTITKKQPRIYRRITPAEVAKFLTAQVLHGNGTAAVRAQMHGYLAPHQRAFMIMKKSEELNTSDFINGQLQQIGSDAVNRLGMLVNSPDERVATKNVHYAIDRLEGKPVQRSESKHFGLNIETVL